MSYMSSSFRRHCYHLRGGQQQLQYGNKGRQQYQPATGSSGPLPQHLEQQVSHKTKLSSFTVLLILLQVVTSSTFPFIYRTNLTNKCSNYRIRLFRGGKNRRLSRIMDFTIVTPFPTSVCHSTTVHTYFHSDALLQTMVKTKMLRVLYYFFQLEV